MTQSFSIDSLLPHTSSQVPILCMLPPPTPTLTSDHQLQGHSNNHCLSPLALLEAAASRLKKRLVSFALIDKEHLDEFLVELAQLTSEGSWVVIEHCHLYSHWQDMLQHILQVSSDKYLPKHIVNFAVYVCKCVKSPFLSYTDVM